MKNIQVFKPFFRTEEILDLIRQCCNESWTGIGGKMSTFESEWIKYSGAQTCHFLNSATAGLHLAILQLKKKYNWDDSNTIISSPLTFVSSNHAILYNNLKPVFADIDDSGCLCPNSLKEKITSETKAVLFVGLGGNVGQLHEVSKICKENNLKLIFDAAHSAGTKWLPSLKQVGLCNNIDVSVFSGQAVKNLPSADSGWICWNGDDAEEMDKKTRQLAWLGIDKSTDQRTQQQGSYKWHYDIPETGYKYHGNAIMGCFGLVGLKYLEQDNAYRRYLCDLYSQHLQDVNGITIVNHSKECLSSRHLFQILVEKRDEVMLALNQYGIYPGVHYRSNSNYSMYHNQDACPKADYYSDHNISLPLHMFLTVEDVKYICDSLKSII